MKKYGFIPVVVLLVIIVLLALPGKDVFEYSAGHMQTEIQKRNYIVSVSRYKEIIQDNSTPAILADLRQSDAYEAAHLPDAVSFPAGDHDVEYLHEFFRQLEGNFFLYADQTATACDWWILLTQMGFENIFVLETGPDLDALLKDWPGSNQRNILVDEIPAFTFVPDTSLSIR